MAVQKLISNGHIIEDIRKYTIGQAQAFLFAIAEEERKQIALNSHSVAMANSKDFNKWIKKELGDG